jgi:D-serine deaminase-like pyridoxal phosphate-dependent protein
MIDHVEQLAALQNFAEAAGFHADIFIKVDSGYGRAGLLPQSDSFADLLKKILEREEEGSLGSLRGFYSHAGHSYGADSPLAAMKLLSEELEALVSAASHVKSLGAAHNPARSRPKYVLSMGATPSASSVEQLDRSDPQSDAMRAEGTKLRNSIKDAQDSYLVELHAGVYPIMDMQQLAAHSSSHTLYGDPAITILVEVASLYDHRKPPEALIAAGSLALGREPCKSYEGWGVVSPWTVPSVSCVSPFGWNIARISQEHGILQPSSAIQSDPPKLSIGQKLRIWPNHACVAGAGYSFYVVVDTDSPEGNKDEVVDIWMRCQGW